MNVMSKFRFDSFRMQEVAPISWCLMKSFVSSRPVSSVLYFFPYFRLLHFSGSLETSLLWCHKGHWHFTDVWTSPSQFNYVVHFFFFLTFSYAKLLYWCSQWKKQNKHLTVNTIGCIMLQIIPNLKFAVVTAQQNLSFLTQSHCLYCN